MGEKQKQKKKWYKSKTIWANICIATAALSSEIAGLGIKPEVFMGIAVVANSILRVMTKVPLEK